MARSPLFDIYDPQGILQQQAAMGLLPEDDEELDVIGAFPVKRKPTISDLMPDDEQRTLMRSLSDMGTSGLAGLGWILDTPGSMARGLLSEGPLKALSALWETSDDRVTGRELLRQYGMIGDKDTWANFGGSLAAEALLDPLTYASLGLNQVIGKGAKTLAGATASKAGLLQDFGVYAKNTLGMGEREALRSQTARNLLERLPEGAARDSAMRDFTVAAGSRSVDDLLDQPLAKMNRVSIPFMQPDAADLFGKQAGDWLAKKGDEWGESLMTNPYTGRAAREIERAFNPDVLGFVDRDRQWDAKSIMAARRAREAQDRFKLAGLQYDANTALRGAGSSLNAEDVSQAMRNYLETGEYDPGMRGLMSLPEVSALTGFFEGYRGKALNEAKRLGLPLNEFQSKAGIDFFPRQQLAFDKPQVPTWPEGVTPPERLKRPAGRGNTPVTFDDNYGRGRRDYTDVMGGSATLNRMSLDGDLQQSLRGMDNTQAREAIEQWSQDNLGDSIYSWMDELNDEGEYVFKAPPLPSSHPAAKEMADLKSQLAKAELGGELARASSIKDELAILNAQAPELQRVAYRDSLNSQMADFLRSMDPQHATTQTPVFAQNSFNEMARYVLGRGRVETNASEMANILKRNVDRTSADAVLGGVNYTPAEALEKLGLTGETAMEVLEKNLGAPLDSVSFNKKFIDDWSRVVDHGKMPPELSPLLQKYDDFTKSFKTLALLWPARYSRDAYSGAFSAAMKNSFSPSDWATGTQIGRGEYAGLLRKIKDLPRYRDLATDEEKLRAFLVEAGAQGLGSSTAAAEVASEAGVAGLREMYPGGAAADRDSLASRARNASWTDWINPFSVRNASGNRNPILEAGDRAAEFTDAGNRYGSYLTQIRKGVSPAEAKRVTDLTQVNYSPEAFTEFERNVMRRLAPFYSYTRGIAPLVADEVVNNPAGLMGKSIRAITRGSQPSEDNFTPEYLRQSASIPLPEGIPLVSLDDSSGLTRYLTNIDLPYESLLNLFSPGVGNSLFDKAGSTFQKTALNILGQTNPLIKGPLELATNRQFFSGRQLSDLYSMLEQPLGSPGRVLEQVISNAPGGSRVLGTVRQLRDDRLGASEKYSKFLVNALTGLKFQDVDQERTKRLAARDMLNQLLETTPGVRTYENLTVPADVLASMPKEQKDMYLLYKIIQSEAAKRARDKKKRETAIDPLQLLGVLNDA